MIEFNPYIAERVGVRGAVIHDYCTRVSGESVKINGRWYTKIPLKQFEKDLYFMTHHQIRLAIKKLIENGLMYVEKPDKNAMDQTSWYSIVPLDDLRESA